MKCEYSENEFCNNSATNTFNKFSLCDQHYKKVIDLYNQITRYVANGIYMFQDNHGNIYEVNKDKLI